MNDIPYRQIRAVHDAGTIRVYQAYNHAIADAALKHGTFVSPPFSMTRMTWVKPSFLWMMYRAGWGHKDDGQRRILAVDISREGFDWALAHGCPSHPEPGMTAQEWERLKTASPVRIQWDPERDLHLAPQNHRSLQLGIGGEAVKLYVREWIRTIADVTPLAHEIHALVEAGRLDDTRTLLPFETPYPG